MPSYTTDQIRTLIKTTHYGDKGRIFWRVLELTEKLTAEYLSRRIHQSFRGPDTIRINYVNLAPLGYQDWPPSTVHSEQHVIELPNYLSPDAARFIIHEQVKAALLPEDSALHKARQFDELLEDRNKYRRALKDLVQQERGYNEALEAAGELVDATR